MNTQKFDKIKKAERFQSYLQNFDIELDKISQTAALQDFVSFEEEEGQMTFDTFKERLNIRISWCVKTSQSQIHWMSESKGLLF